MRAAITGALLAWLVASPLAHSVRAEDESSSPHDDAITICEQTVAEQLGEAGDLQWPRRGDYRTRRRDGGDYLVEGWVERLGPLGVVRRPWSCVASSYGSGWRANAQLGNEGGAPAAPAPAAAPPPVAPAPAAPAPAASPLAAPVPSAAAAPSDVESAAPAEERCRAVRFVDVTREVREMQGLQIFRGRVQNFGPRPARGLRVCAAETCTSGEAGEPPVPPGGSASFTLQVPTLGRVELEPRCAAPR